MKNVIKKFLCLLICVGSLTNTFVFAEEETTDNVVPETVAENNTAEEVENNIAEPVKRIDEYENAYQLYVSPDGNDSNPGTKDQPLASMEGARLKVRSLKNTGRYNKRQIAVNFLPGEYRYGNLNFSKEDSGAGEGAEVIYRAAEPGTVKLKQTKVLKITDLKPVADGEMLARFPEESRDEIRMLDLSPYLSSDDWIGHNYEKTPPRGEMGASRILLNEKKQTIARWPNVGYEDWWLDNGEYAIVNSGSKANNEEAVLKYNASDINIDRWTTADDAIFKFNENWIWGSMRLNSVDTEKKELHLQPYASSLSSAGPLLTGYNMWFIANLVEELDIPGEYYIDDKNKILYYYPPYELDPDKDLLEIITGKVRTAAIFFAETSNIVVKDLDFIGLNSTGIRFNQSNNVIIDGCTFAYGPGYMINMNKCDKVRVRNNTIISCEGGISVSYSYSDGTNLDRAANMDCDIIVENNHTWDTNREALYTNTPILLDAPGGIARNNTAHNSFGAGMAVSGAGVRSEYNELYNLMLETTDSSAMHTGRRWDMYGSTVEYTFIHDIGNPKMTDGMSSWPCGGIYWDDTYSGTAGNYNIIVPGRYKTAGKRGFMLNSGRDHGGTGNIVCDASELVQNYDVYAWYAVYNDGSHPSGAEYNGAAGGAKESFFRLYNYLKDKHDSPYYQKYGKLMEILYYDVVTTRQFFAKNIVFEKNVVVNTNYESSLGGTLSYNRYGITNNDTVKFDNYIADKNTSKYDIFIDPDNLDYRVSDKGKEILGIDEDFVLDKDFDLSKIGVQYKIETGDPFNKLYPRDGEVTPSWSNEVTLKWDPAIFADEYLYRVYRKSDNKLVVEDTSVYNGAIVKDLEPNTEYYWTVSARFTSFKDSNEWESAQGATSFTTGDFTKIKEDVIADSIVYRFGDDRMFVNGVEEKAEVTPQHRDMSNPGKLNTFDVLTWIPFETFVKKLGGTYNYNEETKTINVSYGERKLNFTLDKAQYTLNTKEQKALDGPRMINGVVCIPTHLIADAFGVNVMWERFSQTWIISKTIDSLAKVEFDKVNELYK